MSELSKLSTEELEAEILRRKEERAVAARPQLVGTPDMTDLISACEGYITEQLTDSVDDDTEHYIFELAMISLYGRDIFEQLRKGKK